MYIALKWLLSLNFLLWFGLCISDILYEKFKDVNVSELNSNIIEIKSNLNIKLKSDEEELNRKKTGDTFLLYFISFVMAGLFSLFFKRNSLNWRRKFYFEYLNFFFHSYIIKYILECASYLFNKSSNYIEVLQLLSIHFWNNFCDSLNCMKVKVLKRLKELKDEKRKVKEVKTKCQWNTMANNSTALYAKQIKKNIFHYLSYQQLYLISHQENIFLKSRIEKMLKEKENVERNLLSIVNQVYLSNNNKLKAYCSKFVVQTKDNLFKSDVKAEVQQFLENYQFSIANTGTNINKMSKTTCNKKIQSKIDWRLDTNGPKFRQYPEEYVWTVKGSNGMIQKLFECETDLNNAEGIRRIREYSVYYIKESFLDHHRILSNIQSNNNGYTFQRQQACTMVNQNFLTSSHVFRRFLKNNPTFMIKEKRIHRPPSLLEI